MKKFAILAVLALAVTANAAITMNISAPEDLGNGLCKYTISGTTDDAGYGINAVDATITGTLNQQVYPPFLPTSPLADDFAGAVDLSQDTHFLALAAEVLQGRPATESVGQLDGALAWTAQPYPPSRDLIQVVVPCGSAWDFRMEVGAFSPTGGALTQSFEGSIPEPASLALMGLGAFGLIRRRR